MAINDEIAWYEQNWKELYSKYPDRVLVIVNKAVVGDYPDDSAAYLAAIAKYEPGSFLIQPCKPEGAGFSATYHSRVILCA